MSVDNHLRQAMAYRQAGNAQAAVESYENAIKEDPNDPRPYSALGLIALEQDRHEEARGSFAKAVELDPDNTAHLHNLGLSLTSIGDFEGAEAQYRRSIAVDEGFVAGYFFLSQIVKLKAPDPLIDKLERLKQTNRANKLNLSLIGFALGKFYDDLQEWDKAFSNYAEGNALMGARYDYQGTLQFFAETKNTFTASFLESKIGTGLKTKKPVFIIGMPRSGSSLIEELLSRHEDVSGLGEREELSYIVDAVAAQHPSRAGYPGAVPHISDDLYQQLARGYLAPLEKIAPDSKRIIDKNLLNFQAAGFIRLILPDATILHARRDPIDTCLSCFFQRFQTANEFSFNLTDLGKHFAAYADLMIHWDSAMPGQITTHDYEDVIANRSNAVSSLFEAIDLTPPPEHELVQQAKRNIVTSSAWQARQPVYNTSVKRWKRYEKHLAPLFKALEEAGFNYDGVG